MHLLFGYIFSCIEFKTWTNSVFSPLISQYTFGLKMTVPVSKTGRVITYFVRKFMDIRFYPRTCKNTNSFLMRSEDGSWTTGRLELRSFLLCLRPLTLIKGTYGRAHVSRIRYSKPVPQAIKYRRVLLEVVWDRVGRFLVFRAGRPPSADGVSLRAFSLLYFQGCWVI